MTDNRTTELREKLDKLGIKHLDSDLPYNKQTRWNRGAGGWGACYVEITHGSILPADSIIDNCTLRIYDCTPEQAIAATLGNELNPDGLPVGLTISEDGELLNWRGENYVKQSTLGSGTQTAEQVFEVIERCVKFYEGGDYDAQEIADELNAELGSGILYGRELRGDTE